MSTVERTVMLNIPMKVRVDAALDGEELRDLIGNVVAKAVQRRAAIHSLTMDVKVTYDQIVFKNDAGEITRTYYQKGS